MPLDPTTPTGKLTTRTHFLRYSLLIRRLQRGRASRAELTELVLTELADVQGSYSRASLRRDLVDVEELFGVVVGCCRRTNLYYIDEAESGGVDDRRLQLLEAWETQHFLGEAAALKPFVQFDARRHGTGTQHLRPLLRAVRERREVRFAHRKHWDDMPTTRRAWPLGLKEWAGRWYLLALDQTRAGEFRSFGLDRMRELTETAVPFPAQAFDAAEYFRDCFGVTRPVDAAPVELVLSFTWAQGRYVEDQPLHASQTLLRRSFEDDEIRVRLRVYWTHEMKMALLAYGDDVQVLAPPVAQADVAAAHRPAAGQDAI